MLPTKSFLIRNLLRNQCLVGYKSGEETGIHLAPCDESSDMLQRWTFRFNDTAIQNLQLRLCFDAAMSKMPIEWLQSPKSLSNLGVVKEHKQDVELFPCDNTNVNQVSMHQSLRINCMKISMYKTVQVNRFLGAAWLENY